ncbi:MAG: hypothetical protein Fur006_40720 [Coleofasciculaceae cyanobacterium]
MAAPLESSVVRIYSKSGKVVGAGFLVSSKYVITCAHVVTDALGIPRTTQEQPDVVINLDFPLLAAKQLLTAKLIFWRPLNPNEQFEDIAGLELETALPDTARPAQLVTSDDLWGHSFRVLGFPAGQSNGVSASGVLRGRNANGWVHIEDVKETGYRLEPGFSGAPVWDEELQGVAGMAVAAEMNRPEVKAAFIIPTSLLVIAWSVLGEQAIPCSSEDRSPATNNPISMPSTQAIEVFFSYSQEDEDLLDELERQLSVLKRQRLIKVWSARELGAGDELEPELDKHLNTARVILLLISGNFLADYGCETEVKRAMERYKEQNTIVIPIILRPCDWRNAPFGKFKPLPTNRIPVTSWTNRDEALFNVAEGIRTVIEKLTDGSS